MKSAAKMKREGSLGASGTSRPAIWTLLGAAILIALLLRIWGVGFGRDLGVEIPLSFSYHQDEPKTLTRALAMVETGDLDPRWFHYPSLGLYLHAAAQWLSRGLLPDPDPYVVSRLLTALLGTLTVACVAVLGTRLLDLRAGAVAAGLLAVSFLHVRSSHFVTTDVPMALFTAVAGLLAHEFARGRRGWTLGLSFVAAGLAAGTKYNGAAAVALPLLAVLARREDRWVIRLLRGVGGVAVAAAAFVATTPYLLAEPDVFRAWFEYLHDYQTHGQFGFERAGPVDNFLYLSGRLLVQGVGPPGAALGLVGGVLCLRRHEMRRGAIPLLGFSVTVLGWLATYRTSFTRNLMPLVPFVAVFGGAGAILALDLLRRRMALGARAAGGLAGALVVGILAFPFAQSTAYDLAIAASTRTRALAWIEENLPAGSLVATEVYGPPLSLVFPGRYRLLEMWSFGQNLPSVEVFDREGVDFIVTNAGASEMVYSNPGSYPKAEAIYDGIAERYKLMQELAGDRVDPLYSSISPTMRIYDCRARRGAKEPRRG